jgi:hypothetical protein
LNSFSGFLRFKYHQVREKRCVLLTRKAPGMGGKPSLMADAFSPQTTEPDDYLSDVKRILREAI